MRLFRFGSVLAGFAALCSFAAPAVAQDSGFALNRFDPAERGSRWFVLESLDYDGHVQPTLGLTGDWAYKPLVLFDGDDNEVQAIVEHQVFAHVGASLVLWDDLRLGLNLPLAVVNSGEEGTTTNTNFSSDQGATVGDVRLGADYRLLGEKTSALKLALGVGAHLPTGSESAFTGDGSVRVVPRAMIAGDAGQLAWAGRVNTNIRTKTEDFGGSKVGSEIGVAASIGVKLVDDQLLLGPEFYGATTYDDAFARQSTSLEVLLGGHYSIDDEWTVGAAAGPGLSQGFGTPALRVVASIEWRPGQAEENTPPPPPPPDRDRDAVPDYSDACPDTPGLLNPQHPEKSGCPLPGDLDKDGVFDDVDTCLNVPGLPHADPGRNGCPPPDRDQDGVLDDADACVDEVGVPTEDPKTNGCPKPVDIDADSILDEVDACPTVAGPANADPKKHGCPTAQIDQGQIKIIEKVKFGTGSADILPESNSVLEAVKKLLEDNPDIEKLSIEGHTDSRGNKFMNQNLSARRAKAVVAWLTKSGVAAGRLTSAGFGQSKPIDSNDTEAGRQNNRRVEFHITQVKEGSTIKPEER